MNNTYNGHLVIVFALEHYNPLGHLRSLGEQGINPIYISVKRRGDVAALSKYISVLHRADSVEEGYQLLLEEYGNFDYDHRPYLIFSDDKTMGFFDLHYAEVKDKFIFFNAGNQGRINEFMDKMKILEIAKKHGFKVLESKVVKIGEIPEGLEYPIITKDISPNSGNWKSDVFICENEEELKNAYSKITSPLVLLQRYIHKKNECTLEGFTINKGTEMLVATQMTYNYVIDGYYSPYGTAKMFTDKKIEKNLIDLFSEIGFEGIFETEFLIDQDGTYYFLEINFRASAWNYAAACAGMPLSYLWIKSMENKNISDADRKSFKEFTFMSEVIDFGKRVDTGRISLAEWIKEFKEAKCTYYYNSMDPAPFEMLYEKWDNYK